VTGVGVGGTQRAGADDRAETARRAWRLDRDGVIARFRLTPNASKEALDGLVETPDGAAISARVRAIPQDGEANDALEELVARWLGLAKRSVALVAGARSRVKSVRIAGDPERLDTLLQDATRPFTQQQ
jgi:uncharacterized protein